MNPTSAARSSLERILCLPYAPDSHHSEGDGYVALCPELDVASQGNTVEEARRNLQEAVELFLEAASPAEVQERLRSEVYVTRLEVARG